MAMRPGASCQSLSVFRRHLFGGLIAGNYPFGRDVEDPGNGRPTPEDPQLLLMAMVIGFGAPRKMFSQCPAQKAEPPQEEP